MFQRRGVVKVEYHMNDPLLFVNGVLELTWHSSPASSPSQLSAPQATSLFETLVGDIQLNWIQPKAKNTKETHWN